MLRIIRITEYKNIHYARIFQETLSTVFIEWIRVFSFFFTMGYDFCQLALFLRVQNCLIPLQSLTRRPCNGIDKSVDMCILGV